MGDPTDGPLTGITVLDFSTVGPATRCSRLLADYGARVVKVESTRPLPFAPMIPMRSSRFSR